MFPFVVTTLGNEIHGNVKTALKKLSNGIVKTGLGHWTCGAMTGHGNTHMALMRLKLGNDFCV